MTIHPVHTTMMIIIIAIIQIAAIIVFFVMANNVAKIRKKLYGKLTAEDYIDIAKRETYVGSKKSATENYLRAKYHYLHDSSHNNTQDELAKRIVEIDEEIDKLKK